MKKIYLVVQKNHCETALQALRELAAVHVEHIQAPHGHHIQNLREKTNQLARALEVLTPYRSQPQTSAGHWQEILQQITDGLIQQEELREDIAKHLALIAQWEPWGHFEPKEIEDFKKAGIYINLYAIPVKALNQIPDDAILQTISVQGGLANCVVISREKKELPFPEVSLPIISLNEIKSQLEKEKNKLSELNRRCVECGQFFDDLEKIYLKLREELEFEETKGGLGVAEELAYLKGFIPAERADQLIRSAQKEQWGLLIEDPTSEDRVPTLLRNPRWARLIEPLYNMMNVMPGYRELDISPFFLIFFSIFFGMLVGDAGYGLIFLLITLIAHWKLGKRMPEKAILYLTYILSTVTIIWGLLTGTVFGTLLFKEIFKPILPWLTEIKNVQMLCFALGAVHLTISHLWRFINKIPQPMGMLSEIGWITLLWIAFFLAKILILGEAFSMMVVYVGLAAIVIITADIIAQRQEVGVNLFLLFFSVIGVFTDVVSYIRLFAVGLATVAIADSFNQIALDIGFHNILQAILASLVLIFVHLFLNLILAMLGVLVHGLRLNILEFSSHLNLEWSGIKYAPFRNLKEAKA